MTLKTRVTMRNVFRPPTIVALSLTLALYSFSRAAQAQTPSAQPGRNFKASNGMEMVWVAPMNGWVGKYLVTQDEYQKVRGSNPSHFKGLRKPVETVSWDHAMAYCKKLNEQDHGSGLLPSNYQYSLPTSAQYDIFVADASLDDAVTSQKTKRTSTEDVGTLSPNKFGLYDTRGNVWEWCLDWLNTSSPKDKVLRGAAWATHSPVNLALAYHLPLLPADRDSGLGFRCVIVPVPGRGSEDHRPNTVDSGLKK